MNYENFVNLIFSLLFQNSFCVGILVKFELKNDLSEVVKDTSIESADSQESYNENFLVDAKTNENSRTKLENSIANVEIHSSFENSHL